MMAPGKFHLSLSVAGESRVSQTCGDSCEWGGEREVILTGTCRRWQEEWNATFFSYKTKLHISYFELVLFKKKVRSKKLPCLNLNSKICKTLWSTEIIQIYTIIESREIESIVFNLNIFCIVMAQRYTFRRSIEHQRARATSKRRTRRSNPLVLDWMHFWKCYI